MFALNWKLQKKKFQLGKREQNGKWNDCDHWKLKHKNLGELYWVFKCMQRLANNSKFPDLNVASESYLKYQVKRVDWQEIWQDWQEFLEDCMKLLKNVLKNGTLICHQNFDSMKEISLEDFKQHCNVEHLRKWNFVFIQIPPKIKSTRSPCCKLFPIE